MLEIIVGHSTTISLVGHSTTISLALGLVVCMSMTFSRKKTISFFFNSGLYDIYISEIVWILAFHIGRKKTHSRRKFIVDFILLLVEVKTYQ